MPKKTKKKASKKSPKKAVKKTAKKKATKKAASRPAKKKVATKSVRAAGPKGGPTLRQPNICVDNFAANNSDPVAFQSIPSGGVTLSQASPAATYPYPFAPVTGTTNGLKYTNVPQNGQVVVAVSNLNQTYYYEVSPNANCSNDAPGHSVTVNS